MAVVIKFKLMFCDFSEFTQSTSTFFLDLFYCAFLGYIRVILSAVSFW